MATNYKRTRAEQAAANRKNASADILKRTYAVRQHLKKIVDQIAALESKALFDKADWCDAGSMGHIETRLNELANPNDC